MMRLWVELHYYDFERDPQLLEKLKVFVGGVKSKKLNQWVISIHRFLKKVCWGFKYTHMHALLSCTCVHMYMYLYIY